MHFLALATDYDDTIASDGKVEAATMAALHLVKDSGRKLLLVTGRELDELMIAFPGVALFDLIVAENGALLYDPSTREVTALASPPHSAFVERLRLLGIHPLSVGQSIVATCRPNEMAVLAAIRELGLSLQIIFNKNAVMALPVGVDKASGLAAALRHLGLSRHNVVGIGDAENDSGFLSACGRSVAVANALPSLKEAVDFTTQSARGAGVVELATILLATDLSKIARRERGSRPLFTREAHVDRAVAQPDAVRLVPPPRRDR